jgi:hypothetical protein
MLSPLRARLSPLRSLAIFVSRSGNVSKLWSLRNGLVLGNVAVKGIVSRTQSIVELAGPSRSCRNDFDSRW